MYCTGFARTSHLRKLELYIIDLGLLGIVPGAINCYYHRKVEAQLAACWSYDLYCYLYH